VSYYNGNEESKEESGREEEEVNPSPLSVIVTSF
jgi:hypothetical protein